MLSHIWIGPYLPPEHWMQTWPEQHPEWEYKVFDNAYLHGRDWRLQAHIDEYMKRGAYSGVADMMRYEILLDEGGFIAPADSICLNAVDDLFIEDKAYTVFENELIRGNLRMPFLASPPNNPAINAIIEKIYSQDPTKLGHAYLSTGNYLVGKIALEHPDDVITLPSYTFNPNHCVGISYSGTGKIYSEQFFATGSNLYSKKTGNKIKDFFEKRRIKKQKRAFWKAIEQAQYTTYDDNDLSLLRQE
jgi:hypothetical protein